MRTFTGSRNLFLSFSLSFSLFLPFSPFFFLFFDSTDFSGIFRHRCTKTLFLPPSLPHLVRILLSTNSGCSEQSCTCLEGSQNYSRYHVRCNHVTQLPTKRFCSFSLFFSSLATVGGKLLAPAPQEINFFVSLSDRPPTPPFLSTFFFFFLRKKEIKRLMVNRRADSEIHLNTRSHAERIFGIFIYTCGDILINEIN